MPRLSLFVPLLLVAACGDDVTSTDAARAIDSAGGADAPAVDASSTVDAKPTFDAPPTPDAKPSSVQIVTCPSSGAVAVVASNFTFDKQTYNLAVDGIVDFSVSSGTHTMTSDASTGDTFDSGTLDNTSDHVCFKFSAAGSFPFHCMFHPMTGTVIVQ